MTVDPPAFVLVWTIVVNDAVVGVLLVDTGCDVEDGVDDVDGVLLSEGDDVDDGVVEVLDCELVVGMLTEDEVEENDEVEESEEVETVGVGLLLATELDDGCREELVGVDAA